MNSSASLSKSLAASPSKNRQQSTQRPYPELGRNAEQEDVSSAHQAANRRTVNRSNPQLSYAYGAPSDGKKNAKKPRSSKELSVEAQQPLSPSPGPSALEPLNAASRYKAVKQKQQQQQSNQSPSKGTGSRAVDSPRRSARLSVTGSQDGAAPQERKKAIAAIEEDQAVEEEGEEEVEVASSSTSQQRKRRLLSPGQSRSVNAMVSSFYLDPNQSNEGEDVGEGKDGLPTSLLRSTQRRRDDLSNEYSKTGLDSIRSSEFGDSRSYDYAKEQRYAELLEQSQRPSASAPPTSKWAPGLWFKGPGVEKDRGEEVEGETSLEKKKRKPRTSADNLLYRPVLEEHSDSDSGTSIEGKKHSHRKKKGDNKGARGGRDDNKIWMRKSRRRGGKRDSLGGRDTTSGGEEIDDDDDEVEEEQEEQEEREKGEQVRRGGKTRRAVQRGRSLPAIPLWTLGLAALLIFFSLGLRLPLPSRDPLDYSSISKLQFSSSPPGSLSEASERIVKLEAAFEALKAARSGAVKEESRLAARLTKLESANDKTSVRFAESHATMQNHFKMAEAESARLRVEMSRLQSRLESMHASSHAEDVATGNTLKKRLGSLETRMKQTDEQLKKMAERAKEVERMASEAKTSIDWLEKKLPVEVAVPVEQSTGKPSLDAATWQQLRQIFITKEEGEFQSRNEQSIRSLSLETVEEKIKTGVILSRKDFLHLLESELEKTKAKMEDRFNANAGEMQSDILAKVRVQQDMFEKAGSWKQRGPSQDAMMQFKDGSDAKATIVSLIEEALETYSADRIARRDFALYSAGARVIPSLTSPTFGLQSRSLLRWSSKSNVVVRSPVMALHHDSSPGMCWAFQGDDGQLGIALARKVIVSDVTIDHASAFIAHEAGSSAPREVTVWGLVERREDRRKLAAHRLDQRSSRVMQSAEDDMEDEGVVEPPAPAPPSDNHILLASVTYDVHSPRAVQTFPVSAEARQLAIPVNVVQVRVTSNHGNKDFTCLYRVRIHGQEWTWDDEHAAKDTSTGG